MCDTLPFSPCLILQTGDSETQNMQGYKKTEAGNYGHSEIKAMSRADTSRQKDMPSACPSFSRPTHELSNLHSHGNWHEILTVSQKQHLRDEWRSASQVNTMLFESSPHSHVLITIV